MKSVLNFLLVSLISSLLSIFIYINFFQINKITDMGERPQLIPASYSYNIGNSELQKTDFLAQTIKKNEPIVTFFYNKN